MQNTYWKTLGELVLKKLGPQIASKGGGLAGRAFTIGAVVWGGYEFFKSYNNNIKDEQAYQEIQVYKEEFEKWGSAISCLGRDPYVKGSLGSVDGGGSVNALSEKKPLNLGKILDSKKENIPPNPKMAKELLERAVGYIKKTKNLVEDESFDEQKEYLTSKLRILSSKIKQPYCEGIDYSIIQEEISQTVNNLRPLELAYRAKIYNSQMELEKTIPKNMAWAVASALTLGIVKKKTKDKKKI